MFWIFLYGFLLSIYLLFLYSAAELSERADRATEQTIQSYRDAA